MWATVWKLNALLLKLCISCFPPQERKKDTLLIPGPTEIPLGQTQRDQRIPLPHLSDHLSCTQATPRRLPLPDLPSADNTNNNKHLCAYSASFVFGHYGQIVVINEILEVGNTTQHTKVRSWQCEIKPSVLHLLILQMCQVITNKHFFHVSTRCCIEPN